MIGEVEKIEKRERDSMMPTLKEKQLRRVIEILAKVIDATAKQLSGQDICGYMLELSGAKYVKVHIYGSVNEEVEIVAESGSKENIETDKSIMVNIKKDKEVIGEFTLMIDKGQYQENKDIIELYASQVALLVGQTRAVKECEDSKRSLESIIEATNVGIWEWNIQTNKTVFNKYWATMIGYTLEELTPINQETWQELLHPDDKDRVKAKLEEAFTKPEAYYSEKYRIRHKDGHWIYILGQGRIISRAKDNEPLMMIGTHLNITESERLKDEYQRFFAISTDIFCISDMEGNLINVNDTWQSLLGYSLKDIKSQNFFDFVHPEDIDETSRVMANLRKDRKGHSFVNRYKYSDGSYGYIEWLAQPYDNLIYGSGRDITEKYERQKEVEFLSFRDYLTGLYNRRYMEDALKRLDTSRNLPLTLMVVDINGLKLTNDAFGHEMGDRLIKAVAEIIKNACRSDDVVGRVGGDEFLILLPNTNYIQGKKIKERMLKAAEKSNKDSLIISFAIGSAVKTMDSQSVIDIEKVADKNMYRHKAKYGKIMRHETIETALNNVFSSDATEQIHAERVSLFCGQLAEAMALSPGAIEDAKLGGILHDIGKITVPMEICNKPEKLDKEEWEEIRRHPITGYNILKGVDEYAHLAEAILYHHERPDGKGYPEGLKNKQIPLLSKIIAVSDAYEAMTSNRLYKKTRTTQEAIKELRKHAGRQFDFEIVEVFINKVINKKI